jgi:hypothetical protein
MLYKFIQSEAHVLLDVFEKIVVGGSLKFSSALSFNDPFEFKFNSIAPSREIFDAWHRTYDPGRSADELEQGWASFSDSGADWNTAFVPRQNLLQQLYVLSLASRWDSHLMWSHYAGNHQGYAVIYRPELVAAVEALPARVAAGPVAYRAHLPDLPWFQVTPQEMVRPVLFTKSDEWSYEREFRLVLGGNPGQLALYKTIDPSLIAGVILGTRASNALVDRALALQKARPEFIVRKIASKARSYALEAYDVDGKSWHYGHML